MLSVCSTVFIFDCFTTIHFFEEYNNENIREIPLVKSISVFSAIKRNMADCFRILSVVCEIFARFLTSGDLVSHFSKSMRHELQFKLRIYYFRRCSKFDFNEKKGPFRPKMSNILNIEILVIFEISNGNYS